MEYFLNTQSHTFCGSKLGVREQVILQSKIKSAHLGKVGLEKTARMHLWSFSISLDRVNSLADRSSS